MPTEYVQIICNLANTNIEIWTFVLLSCAIWVVYSSVYLYYYLDESSDEFELISDRPFCTDSKYTHLKSYHTIYFGYVGVTALQTMLWLTILIFYPTGKYNIISTILTLMVYIQIAIQLPLHRRYVSNKRVLIEFVCYMIIICPIIFFQEMGTPWFIVAALGFILLIICIVLIANAYFGLVKIYILISMIVIALDVVPKILLHFNVSEYCFGYFQFFNYVLNSYIFWKFISMDIYNVYWQGKWINFRYRPANSQICSSSNEHTSSSANYMNSTNSSYVSKAPHYPGFNASMPAHSELEYHSPFLGENKCLNCGCCDGHMHLCDCGTFDAYDLEFGDTSTFFIKILSKINDIAVSRRNVKIMKYSIICLESLVMIFMVIILVEIFANKSTYQFNASEVRLNINCKYDSDILDSISDWILLKILPIHISLMVVQCCNCCFFYKPKYGILVGAILRYPFIICLTAYWSLIYHIYSVLSSTNCVRDDTDISYQHSFFKLSKWCSMILCFYALIMLLIFPTYFIVFQCVAPCLRSRSRRQKPYYELTRLPSIVMEENDDLSTVLLKSQIIEPKPGGKENEWDAFIKYDANPKQKIKIAQQDVIMHLDELKSNDRQESIFMGLCNVKTKSDIAAESNQNCGNIVIDMQCASCVRIGCLLRLFQETSGKQLLFVELFNRFENKYDINLLISDYFHIAKYHNQYISTSKSNVFNILCQGTKCLSFRRNSRFRNKTNFRKYSEVLDWMDVIHSFCIHSGTSTNLQFITFIDDKQNDKTQDSEEKTVEIEDTDIDIDETEDNVAKYCFGVNFVYHPPSNSTERRYYIKPKHASLKEELCENKVEQFEWADSYQKANRLMQTAQVKSIKARQFGVLNDKMNITKNAPLTANHLAAVVFYCDFDELCFEFRKTYRAMNQTESIKDIKRRHSLFGNWGKLLFETVKLYGNPADTQKVYYHGLNAPFVFAKFLVYFASPLSTSTNSIVANNFATTKGIIIALEAQPGYTTFDASLCSRFGQESEMLFFGMECLIVNIMFDGQLNHKCEMNALLLMQEILNGEIITSVAVDDENCQFKLVQMLKQFMDKTGESNYFVKTIGQFLRHLDGNKLWINLDELRENCDNINTELLSLIVKDIDSKQYGEVIEYILNQYHSLNVLFPYNFAWHIPFKTVYELKNNKYVKSNEFVCKFYNDTEREESVTFSINFYTKRSKYGDLTQCAHSTYIPAMSDNIKAVRVSYQIFIPKISIKWNGSGIIRAEKGFVYGSYLFSNATILDENVDLLAIESDHNRFQIKVSFKIWSYKNSNGKWKRPIQIIQD